MIDTSALSSATTAIGDSYFKMAKEKWTKGQSIVTKLTALGDIDFSEADGYSTETFGDCIDSAGTVLAESSAILEVLANNPLVARFLEHLQTQYGWDLGSPLALVQSLVGKKGSSLMTVVGGMLQFPVYAEKFTLQVQIIIDSLDAAWAEIESRYTIPTDALSTTPQAIPDAVMQHLTQARILLGKGLGGNTDVVSYASGKQELENAIADLGNTSAWGSMLAADAEAMIIKTVLDSLRNQFSTAALLRDDKAKILSLYQTIKTTVVMQSSPSPSMVKLRKALSDLNKTIAQMNMPNIQHSLLIPQYLIALGAIKATLDMARPVILPPPFAFPNGAVLLNTATLETLYRDLGRLSNILQYPRQINTLRVAIDTAKADLNQWIVERDAFYAQLENLWLMLPGLRELIDAMGALLGGMGMDRAADALKGGDLSKLMDMSAKTAIYSGAAVQGIITVLAVCRGFGITYFDEKLYELKTKLTKTSKKDEAAVRTKRNTKLAMVKKAIEDALQAIDDATALATDVAGLVNVVQVMV